jgi:hypothetical protein
MYKYEKMSRYILNEVETSHHLISIRLYFILTPLIYDEYCLSIMQTITYAHDRTYFQGTRWIVPFDLREWN